MRVNELQSSTYIACELSVATEKDVFGSMNLFSFQQYIKCTDDSEKGTMSATKTLARHKFKLYYI